MNDTEGEEDEKELVLTDLDSPERLFQLGLVVRESLLKFGSATLVLDEQGYVNHVNPLHVFLSHEIVTPPRGKIARPTRPIVVSGRPQFVQIQEDGSVWEVEYADEEDGGTC